MITLFASIAGFISSILPDLFKYFVDKNDKKHEIELFKQQIELAKFGLNAKLTEIENIGAVEEIKALYKTYNTGITWVDALNGTVRPVLAYSFFILYGAFKYFQFALILDQGGEVYKLLDVLWSGEDQAIFASVIGFYFGQRAFSKLKSK